MKIALHFLVLSLFFLGVTACTHKEKIVPRDIASFQATGVEGIWFLQGSSSTRGPYNGELELRKSSDGTYDVIRVATYINYYFDGLKVQEVWVGKAVPTDDSLTISYDLKQGDFITRLDKQKREEKDFRNPVTIVSQFAAKDSGLQAQFSDKRVSTYSEWITTKRNLEAKPLWKDLRQNRDAQGRAVPAAVTAAIKKFKNSIAFDKDPLVKSYKDRVEFKNNTPFFIFDPTDFEFYRENKDVIRVSNKVTDDISIAEAAVRRNAYSPSLNEKQKGYEGSTKDHHLNEMGMVSYSRLDEKGRFTGFIPDIDSALWTGIYVGSQAMRNSVTESKEALFNIRKSLKGIFALLSITGDSAEFARAISTYIPNAALPEGWRRGTGEHANLIWLDGGNSDMLQGIFHAFAWAHMVIPETERELWSQLRAQVVKLPELKAAKEKPQNLAQALGLVALYTGDAASKERYKSFYSLSSTKSNDPFSGAFYYRGNADWNKASLSVVTLITEILIAERLEEDQILSKLREQLIDQWVVYQAADRHIVTLAAQGFAYKFGTRSASFRSESSDEKFKAALDMAKWGLREIPYPRPNLNVSVDHSLAPQWSISPTPREFWKPLKKPTPPTDYFFQGLYNYPVFEFQAFSSNFIWKDSAFMYQTSNTKELGSSGVDYLYGYWIARFGGAVGASDAE
ncbi:hypothetical protein D3C87_86380 [compost metagenome]